jgi:uncharacterized protein (DUF2147 family)
LHSFLTGGLAAALTLIAPVAFADPVGVWRDRDGTTIRIAKCGAALCGTITAMNPPNDPETGNPWTDKHNPEQTKRGEPLIGLMVFIDMQPSGQNKWSGRLYNTDDGRSLNGHLIDRGPNILRVEGCVGTRCGGENLTRVKPLGGAGHSLGRDFAPKTGDRFSGSRP